LNPHAFRRHPLKMVCLPVPPLPQVAKALVSMTYRCFSQRAFFHCTDFAPPRQINARLRPLQSAQANKQPPDRFFAWVHVAHVRLNVIVSGHVLQCDADAKRQFPRMWQLRASRAVERLWAFPFDVSILLGHASVKTTERHYAPFVKARQEQLVSVEESWRI
jgi:hypothetical protein